ncbi:ABC transporter ATP-binding protein [Herbivorax sp. ANBcel31]|uniref:ATP-binding cassette domain-containing protein n=1 Tax=Herbivorax sp. ANBcel31 TaxID=3069754 RepID=UPI0027B3C618|nr:ABC transporter ATP-binding protein [Herbivorax sp. ANBcel31]MDQ2086933.1 ABC transporter ATP-binding protein [Herbivorax sp. ANBcel31]
MLNLCRVTKYYENDIGIEKVSFSVGAGEIVGIVGDNGAGKTTLLKCIMNLVDYNMGGDVTLDGNPIEVEAYKKLSFITEEGSCFRNLTPKKHEDFYKNMLDSFDSKRFNKLLKFFNLPRDKKVKNMSRGERAQLEVAIGFSKGAKYILMDEPFMGKDVFTRKDFLKLMIANLKEDESIIVATHLIDEIQNVLSRAVILKKGRIAADVSIEELEKDGKNLYQLMKEVHRYNENRVDEII